MQKSNYFKLSSLIFLLLLSPHCFAGDNIFWIGYNQNTSEFFSDSSGEIIPSGASLGFSTEISKNWSATLSYNDMDGDTANTIFENNQIRLENSGETSSTAIGLSFSWLQEDYSFTFSYSQIDNNENSLTRLPLVLEKITGDDQVFSVSYDRFVDFESWNFGWSLGTQFVKSSITTRDIVGDNPPILIDANFDNESFSLFTDLDFSFPIKNKGYVVTPMLTLSWNSELSNSGDEFVTVIRGDERRTFNQINDRFGTTFRTPDSGFWETGIEFEWDNDWSLSLAYGQSIAADIDVESLSFDFSVAF